ncbi:MAG TPA: hypothetical protein VK536_01795 [Candidatus Limnocylindrales bacterium]|nr:hypothetical protein [Candidatus Limnocylindrales bacterium]
MGELTKLSVATSGKGSLRTTVPMNVLKQFDLKAGDYLDWTYDVVKGELAIVVRPVKGNNRKS